MKWIDQADGDKNGEKNGKRGFNGICDYTCL